MVKSLREHLCVFAVLLESIVLAIYFPIIQKLIIRHMNIEIF